MSTTVPQVNVRLGGIDRSTEPWLLGDDVWYDALNMHTVKGKLVSYPRKTPWCTTVNMAPITAIAYVPSPGKPFGSAFVFSDACVSLLSNADAGAALTPLEVDLEPPVSTFPSTYWRWSTCSLDGRLYFTNLNNKVHYIEGQQVRGWDTGQIPCAAHIEEFFDHLVVGNVNFRGSRFSRRVMWSDLYKVGNWEPKRKNEADHYDCDEPSGGSALLDEITGLRRLGERLAIYTPNTIYLGSYVGLPRVMRIDPAVIGVGCDLRYGLVSVGLTHFFPSFQARNFYSYDGARLVPVGTKVAEYFFSDLTKAIDGRQATWGFFNPLTNEIGWVYVSKAQPSFPFNAAPVFDKAVVMSLETGAWWPISVENLHSFAVLGAPAVKWNGLISLPPDNLVYPWDVLAKGTRESTAGLGGHEQVIWGDSCGNVLSETEADVTNLVPCKPPYLESPDFFYGDVQAVKEISSMSINAELTTPAGAVSSDVGISVEVAVRAQTTDPVVMTALTQEWKTGLVEGRLSFPRMSGKVLRYRFTPRYKSLAPDLPYAYQTRHVLRLPTKKYAVFEDSIDLSDTIKTRTYYPTGAGYVTLVLFGSGGGGGAKSLMTQSLYTFTPSADLVAMTTIPSPKRLKRYYRATIFPLLLTVDFAVPQHTMFTFPVYIPNTGTNPNAYAGVTAAVEQTLHDTLVEMVSKLFGTAGYRLDGWLSFYFQKPIAEAWGVALDSWLTGTNLVTAVPANAWGVGCSSAWFDTSERGLQQGGGGGGAGLVAAMPVTATNLKVILSVFPAVDATVVTNNLHGGTGGDAAAYIEETAKTLKAGGGGGCVVTGGNLIAGAGGTTTYPGGGITGFLTAGDAGTVESPASGWPVTTPGKGGRSWFLPGAKGAYRFAPAKGALYGGGGSGAGDTFIENLATTNGASGFAKIGWRVDPVDGTLKLLGGFPNLLIRKRPDSPLVLNRTLSSDASSVVGIYTVTVKVAGVFEMNTYQNGGVAEDVGSCYTGGTAAYDQFLRMKVYYAGGPDVWLNHTDSIDSGCVEASGTTSFQIDTSVTPLPSVYMFNIQLGNDSLLWELADTNGVALSCKRYGVVADAQTATVVLSVRRANVGKLRKFTFNGFVPNIYAKGAEK